MDQSLSSYEKLIKSVRENPEYAQIFLDETMNDVANNDDKSVLLKVLRIFAEAQGGMAELSENSGINREALYRALGPSGNPTLTTLIAVLNALGFRLCVTNRL